MAGDHHLLGCSKITKTQSPNLPTYLIYFQSNTQLIKMAKQDWSAGVYWEPKSPEWPNTSHHSCSNAMSPDRLDQSPLSPYSKGNQSGFSPEYRGSSNKRARWEWSPESGVSTGEGSSASPNWTEYQWSPSGSSSPHSPFSGNDGMSEINLFHLCIV